METSLPARGIKRLVVSGFAFVLYNKVIQCKSSGNDEGAIPIGLTSLKKRATFPTKKRYLKIQVPKNQQTNHPRFSKLRNGIAPMPEPHRRGVAIANGFSMGKCDEIPPQARFFLYKNVPPTTLEGHRKPF